MSRTSRVVRRVIALGERNPLLPPQVADPWLVGLRWVAAFGMLGTTLLAKGLVPALRSGPILAVIGSVAALNLVWRRVVRRAKRSFVIEQLACDMVLLGAILWFSGGVTNPFASFLTFQIALAGLLAGGQASVLMTILALALAGILFFAPPLSFESATLPEESIRSLAYFTSLAGLSSFLGLSAYIYGERLAEVRAEKERNEQLAMLGRVAGGMAHELNTPLATILLASEELVGLVDNAKSPEVRELARTVAVEARRAAELIELLRGQVRLDSRMESLDLVALLADWVPRELDRLNFAGERVVALPEGPVVVQASASGLRQIVTNLLTNAVQATSAQRRPRIEVELSVVDGRVLVVVADNGHGIPSDVIARIGEPFQTTKELTGGTGLGLYVCSVIAKRMGARLELESREGLETRVTLSLRGAPRTSAERKSWPASPQLSS